MEKALVINCGEALLLRYRPEMFEDYSTVVLNAGSAVMAATVHAALQSKRFMINCGESRVIEVQGTPVDIGENAVIDRKAGYEGQFLVSTGKVWIETDDPDVLSGVTGLYTNRLYYPESFPLDRIPGLVASRKRPYPDGAVLEKKGFELTAGALKRWKDGSLVWTEGDVTALDSGALAAAKAKGIVIQASQAVLYEKDIAEYGGMFRQAEFVAVPDGYEVIQGDLNLLPETPDIYGDKLFVLGDLMVTKQNEALLKELGALVVQGVATLPATGVKAFRAIGTAESIKAYRGTLWRITGADSINHEQLRTACERGIQYTLEINGAVSLDSDVTPEDLDCILSFSYNGTFSVPDGLKALLLEKLSEGNGVMRSTREGAGKEAMLSEFKEMLEGMGIDITDINVINQGDYVMI